MGPAPAGHLDPVARGLRSGDPLQLLGVLGISLHQVQDFYTHTNWIEPQSAAGTEVPLGSDGPGWQARGFGSSPTWFDVPTAEREKVTIYAAATAEGRRTHGEWDGSDEGVAGDGNATLSGTMAKDWHGRPLYLQSAIAAYFATRQWVRAVRSWVADEACWARAQRYSEHLRELRHDQVGSFGISLYAGRWQGQGDPTFGEVPGPGGSIVNLRAVIRSYFKPRFVPLVLRGRTMFRSRFEDLILRMADFNPPGQIAPVPSSQDLQRAMRIVCCACCGCGPSTWATPASITQTCTPGPESRASRSPRPCPRPRPLLLPLRERAVHLA